MNGIAEIIKHAYSIFNKAEVPDQIKLHALNLIAECQQRRLDMATSGEIIEHGIQFVERMRANVSNLVRAIPQDQVREILHDDVEYIAITGNDDSSGRIESSDFKDDNAVTTDVNNPKSNGIDSGAAATSSLEEQIDEDLSLTDPDTATTTAADDSDEEEEAPTTNTIF
jgi:hypothetical protein